MIGALVEGPLVAGGRVELDEDTAHHLRVRRAEEGTALRVTDGRGALGVGVLVRVAKRAATVELTTVERAPGPPPFELLVPVADRDRMLLLAEKATEVGVRGWRPVRWRRSRSVSPRGEGEAFRAKVRARMIGALVQSGGAWLPEVREECDVGDLETPAGGVGVLLHQSGPPLLDVALATAAAAPVALAVGPEGGVEPDEADALIAGGFRAASLGPRVLRFETAAIVALGVLHAARASRLAGSA